MGAPLLYAALIGPWTAGMIKTGRPLTAVTSIFLTEVTDQSKILLPLAFTLGNLTKYWKAKIPAKPLIQAGAAGFLARCSNRIAMSASGP